MAITESSSHFIAKVCMYQANCGMELEEAKERVRKELGMVTDEMRRTMHQQIGMGNILSISGGRVWPTDKGICLPVSNGYRVLVEYDQGWDDYTVKRVFIRDTVEYDHGKVEHVYAAELGQVAYRAGMFRSWGKDEWMSAA